MLNVEGSSETTLFRERSNQNLTVCNFGNTLAMTMTFFLKCLMYDEQTKKGKKNGEKSVWSLRSYHLNTELQIPTIPKRIPVIGSQCVKKER